MKEFKIGERVTLEITESEACADCFFFNLYPDICPDILLDVCGKDSRSDGKNVIFKEVKE